METRFVSADVVESCVDLDALLKRILQPFGSSLSNALPVECDRSPDELPFGESSHAHGYSRSQPLIGRERMKGVFTAQS